MSETLLEQSRTPETWEWMGKVVYQIYPRTFKDANGDGIGDIRGIIEKQDYLDELGVDVIWLSPPFPSGGFDGGYDISNHTGIDPELGTLQDIEELITICHERGRKIILDFVPNHTSHTHEWFKNSCDDSAGDFADYYIWANPKKVQPGDPPLPHNIVAGNRLEGLPEGYAVPNNWSSIFSLPELEKLKKQHGGIIPDNVEVPAQTAWVWHPGRQQFYLAEFTKEQPSLNWNSPAVRKAQLDVLRFWLDKGVDGFRVDVINHIGKDYTFTDEAPTDKYIKGVHNPHDQWTQERMVSYWPTLKQYALEMLAVADEYPDRNIRFVLEDWATAMTEGMDQDALSRLRPDTATVFNFRRLLCTNRDRDSEGRSNWNADTHKRLLDSYHEPFQIDPELRGGTPNEVDSNHDVPRVASRLGYHAARAAALIKLTTPGTPYIYMGEEGGFFNVRDEETPPHRLRDADTGLRDGERRPMMWDGSKHAGFSQASEGDLWLPMATNDRDRHLKDQVRDPLSPFSLFRALIAARRHLPELHTGIYNPLATDNPDALAFGRADGRRQSITVANFSGNRTEVAILNTNQGLARVAVSSLYGTAHDRQEIELGSGRVGLDPHEALLLTPVS